MALMIVCGAAMAPAWPEPLTPRGLAAVGMPVRVMFEVRQIDRARQLVVHERSAEQLAGIRIVHGMFGQCLADPLSNAALDLADRQQRIDQRAVIIDGGVAIQCDEARFGIDLYFRDVAAVGDGDDVEQIPDVGVQGRVSRDR